MARINTKLISIKFNIIFRGVYKSRVSPISVIYPIDMFVLHCLFILSLTFKNMFFELIIITLTTYLIVSDIFKTCINLGGYIVKLYICACIHYYFLKFIRKKGGSL